MVDALTKEMEYVMELRFSNREVDEWNRLSNHIISGKTLEGFKRRIDKCIDEDDRWN